VASLGGQIIIRLFLLLYILLLTYRQKARKPKKVLIDLLFARKKRARFRIQKWIRSNLLNLLQTVLGDIIVFYIQVNPFGNFSYLKPSGNNRFQWFNHTSKEKYRKNRPQIFLKKHLYLPVIYWLLWEILITLWPAKTS